MNTPLAQRLLDTRLRAVQRQRLVMRTAAVIGNQRMQRMLARSVAPVIEEVDDSAAHASTESLGKASGPVLTEDVKINFLTPSTPVQNNATLPADATGVTTIKLSDVKIRGKLIVANGEWKIKVTSASTTIHWIAPGKGFKTPKLGVGGNITKSNWKTVIAELEGYEARQSAGAWHSKSATVAHEKDHVAWYKAEILSTWPGIEGEITAEVLGNKPGVGKSAATAAMKTFLDQKRHDWFNAYGVAPEDRAYTVGQAVLDKIVVKIKAHAAKKGWT